MTFPTSFQCSADLARLPWFDTDELGQLVVDPAVGPIIDMHSHVAMGNFRRLQVDVTRSTPRTAHYLPADAPIDLEVYSNRNLDPEAMFAMKLDVSLLSLTSWGKRTTHTGPNLLRDMDAMGIERSVVLPIDLPVGASNADVALRLGEFEPRLVPFGSVHPASRHVDARLDDQVRRGARGMKFHPNAQFMAPDHPKVIRWCGACGQRGLPVLFHCGPVGIEPAAAAKRSQVVRYEEAIASHPETTFILGHCGALQHRIALDRLVRYPNVIVELSSLGLTAIREILDEVPADRVVFGTDWPFYHQSLTLARVLIATEGDEPARRAVLHDNADRLLARRDEVGSPSVQA